MIPVQGRSIAASLASGLLALGLFGYSGAGPTPALDAADLPLAVLSDCDSAAACGAGQSYSTQWVGRTPSGNLFLIARSGCAAGDPCNAWFVEKTPGGLHTRLVVDGQFSVQRARQQGYPDIRVRRVVSEGQALQTRFSWVGGRYVETEHRNLYRVEGIECGSEAECHEVAKRAYEHRDPARALKIWETVHGFSWI